MRPQERGFSLVELLIVVVVAGIVLATGLPAFIGHTRTLMRVQARERVMEDLRFARQLAVTEHQPVVVAFGNGVATSGITSYTIHLDADGDRVKDTAERQYLKRMPARTSLGTAQFTPVDSLVFDIGGTLWPGTTGGRLVVTSPRGNDTLFVSGAGMVYRP